MNHPNCKDCWNCRRNHQNHMWNRWNHTSRFRSIHMLIRVQWNPVQSRRVGRDCRKSRDYYTVHSQSLSVHWKCWTGRSVQASCSGLNRTTWLTESVGVHKDTCSRGGLADYFPAFSSTLVYLCLLSLPFSNYFAL